MLCNRFFCTLCKLYNPLLPSESQDWVFKVIIDFLGPLQIFNDFSTDFFASFELLYLYEIYPKHIIKICIPYNLIFFHNLAWFRKHEHIYVSIMEITLKKLMKNIYVHIITRKLMNKHIS